MSTNDTKTTLTDEQKQQAADAIKNGIRDGIEATKGRNLTWYERILWILALVAASVIQSFFGAGCQYITPELVAQAVDNGHELYHLAHPDKPCIIRVDENTDK